MAVNALVTGLIVFKILKVFLQVKAVSVKGSTGPGGTTLRHVIFVIIESGMALFAIQLARVVLDTLPSNDLPHSDSAALTAFYIALYLVDVINDTFIVIIKTVYFYFFLTDNIYLARPSYQR